ncbi:MAG: ThuA domain-containing protein [Gemmatimonadota bacterium]|nr:ThuA domain-containing protein [Gemmatimonadota bacterium]
MKKTTRACLAACALVFLFCGPPAAETINMDPFFRQGALRALILSGHNNHDWRKSTPMLKEILLKTGRFDVRVNEEPVGISAATLAPFDLLVLDYMGPDWGPEARSAVEDFVASGKGMVVVHGAIYAFSGNDVLTDGHKRTGITEPAWEEYATMAGGMWIGDSSAHGDRHSFEVKFTDREHPVAKGMEKSFIATDELYHDMRMQPEAEILATTFSDPETRGSGEDEPILWSVRYGAGRVFYTALGHDPIAMSEPGFSTTFARGCEWAATGEVTLPARISLNDRPDDALRALVVTGGHSFDTEFYTLFDCQWLTWDHAVSNHEAFRRDIREDYDVLVLFDLSREISKDERKNLRLFVESGKGLVVLHHAIADYNSWDWWCREVVGGKYLLEPEGDMPGSTYLHDVELFVRSVGKHPITRGLGPMHLVDETYKGMWISPRVQVILETDEPTSDGPLAWISPYGKSRVVYVQLGHDRHAYNYPGYRDLVRRAILWAGGRLE